MRYSLLLILLGYCTSFHAQIKIGVRGYYGRSTILNNLKPLRPPVDTWLTAYDHNFVGGAYFEYSFSSWLGVETAIMLEQIRSYEGLFIQAETSNLFADQLEFDENGLADWLSFEEWIRLNYLSIPLGVEFRIDRWRFGIGGQYSYLLRSGSSSHDVKIEVYDDYVPFQWANDFDFRRRHNISVYSSIGYNFLDNLSLEIKCLAGLIDISQDLFMSRYWTRQFQLGLSYEIWSKKKVVKN